MNKAVRAIVFKDGRLLAMHRKRLDEVYYSLLGGSIEAGEDPITALKRELQEETGIEIANPRLVFVIDAPEPLTSQAIYLCDYVSGEAKLRADSEEAAISARGDVMYEPTWLSTDLLKTEPFMTEGLRQGILDGIANGFPTEPQALPPDFEIRYTKPS